MEKLYNKKEDCCACGACVNICPKNAITMKKDKYGFLFPSVDSEKCIDCQMCRKVCAYQNISETNKPLKTWVAVSENKKSLEKSASGGVFYTIANQIVKNGGCAVGAGFDSSFNLNHIIADNSEKLKKLQIFNGAQLKYIAFISMLIDHVNNALITPFLNGKGFLLHLSNLFSILGRIAFPIFVFFIVEGFFKTSNRKKYLITLLIFGVISEVPFDMFTSKVFFDPYWNNIMFTLALCLITIWIIDAVKEKISNKVLWYSISIVIVGISCAVAMALSLDYDYHAIIVAYIFYIFYDKPILGAGLGYLSIIKELYSCLGFAMTVTYNGERGKQNKWINYLFYPVHILILGILRFYLNI